MIGRNEGARLAAGLRVALAETPRVVYADSGSADGSPGLARDLGAEVVELDPDRPFSAARGRNEGLERLLRRWPEVERVQFVDGDCELRPGWLAAASAAFADPTLAAVFGRLRERHPERSLYNRLCDIEWRHPAGDAEACGGVAMMRVEAVRDVGGFRDDLIAGEEPELCVRLRERGYRIRCLDAEMALHDAAMLRFGSWWRRAVRAGHAYAEVAWIHRAGPERFWQRNVRSNWLWGAALPLAALLGAPATGGWSLLCLAGLGVLGLRIFVRERRLGGSRERLLYAAACVLAKPAAALGQARFHLGRLAGRPAGLIEHREG